MVSERLEVRLDPERRRKLAELAEQKHAPISDLVRAMIDEAYEEALVGRRLEAVRRISQLGIEDVPEVEELNRQLEGAHDAGVP